MTSFESFCNYFYSELKTWSLMGMGNWSFSKEGTESSFIEMDHETIKMIMLPVLAHLSQTEIKSKIAIELKENDEIVRISIDSDIINNQKVEANIIKNLKKMPGSYSITKKNLVIAIPVKIQDLEDEHELDLNTIASNFGTTIEELIPIIDETFKSMDVRIDRMKNALKCNDYTTIHREAHSIKGSAMNIQANAIQRYAERIEKTAVNSEIKENDFVMLLDKIKHYKLNYKNRINDYAS